MLYNKVSLLLSNARAVHRVFTNIPVSTLSTIKFILCYFKVLHWNNNYDYTCNYKWKIPVTALLSKVKLPYPWWNAHFLLFGSWASNGWIPRWGHGHGSVHRRSCHLLPSLWRYHLMLHGNGGTCAQTTCPLLLHGICSASAIQYFFKYRPSVLTKQTTM